MSISERHKQYLFKVGVWKKDNSRYNTDNLVCPVCKRFVQAIQPHSNTHAAYVHRIPMQETVYCLIPLAKPKAFYNGKPKYNGKPNEKSKTTKTPKTKSPKRR